MITPGSLVSTLKKTTEKEDLMGSSSQSIANLCKSSIYKMVLGCMVGSITLKTSTGARVQYN